MAEPEPVGRLLRHDGERWSTVGEPLPPFEHAPPTPTLQFAPWVLPRELEPAAFDVVVVGELAHQLLGPCADDDPAVTQLVEQTLLFHPADEVAAWLAGVEVWIGRRLDPDRPWPTPS
ncbi:MAG: hypothetical protein AAFZ07_05550 [Actinomycetota bacterium]